MKSIKVAYFNEICYMYDFLKSNNYELVDYTFTFSYGYKLQYKESDKK